MLTKVKCLLESIRGLEGKVVYGDWPEEEAPDMPYVCFEETETDNFFADGIVYHKQGGISVRLYNTRRDLILEARIESAFALAGIGWQCSTDFDENNKCYEISYEIGG